MKYYVKDYYPPANTFVEPAATTSPHEIGSPILDTSLLLANTDELPLANVEP